MSAIDSFPKDLDRDQFDVGLAILGTQGLDLDLSNGIRSLVDFDKQSHM